MLEIIKDMERLLETSRELRLDIDTFKSQVDGLRLETLRDVKASLKIDLACAEFSISGKEMKHLTTMHKTA